MDFRELSIPAIRAVLDTMDEVSAEALEALARDSRSGVRALHAELMSRGERRAALLEKQKKMLELERSFQARGFLRVAGVDEAGRGPLAGPVVAAAVVFPPDCEYPAARDSKQMDEARRERLYGQIRDRALAVGIGVVENEEIDRINIYQASLKAMYEAVRDLGEVRPDAVIVDGPMVLRIDCPQEAVIGGDGRCLSIAAASVMAKVMRDSMMREYDNRYPGYGFARHKGYGTADHERALRELGPCPIHRRSFRQVSCLAAPMGETWAFFHEGLIRAGSLDELETLGRGIRQVRDSLRTDELDSLRLCFTRRRRELSQSTGPFSV